jgi:DeoR/GlpR family transcriptional regulator of sugar metabolism
MVKSNPLINVQELVRLTELASSTVYRVLVKLEDDEKIVLSFGGGKSGYGNTFYSAV